MRIKTTATGGGVYIVTVNGKELSRHNALHKAMESATNAELANPADAVEITQALRITVEAVGAPPSPVPPSPNPSFVDGSWGGSWGEFWGAEVAA
jgi:hypothetical protein